MSMSVSNGTARTSGKLIAITGVSRGLGRALVDEFIRRGHRLVGCARSPSAINELQHTYPTHQFATVDVSSDSEVQRWAGFVIARCGPPDLVLNNAAQFHQRNLIWETSARDFNEVLGTNVRGVANTIRHFAPVMTARRAGVFVNFISRWGLQTDSSMAAYCASKWAVVALSRVAAAELHGYGVTSVALNPGTVRTEMLDRYLRNGHQHAEPSSAPTPKAWAREAATCILGFGLQDSGNVRCVNATAFDREEEVSV